VNKVVVVDYAWESGKYAIVRGRSRIKQRRGRNNRVLGSPEAEVILF